MAREHEWRADLRHLLVRNGRLLTVFAVALILFTGVTVVDDPSRWWVAPAALGVFFGVAFLFLNARGVVKGAVALLALSLTSGYAFKAGALFEPDGRGASLWLCLTFASFFGELAASFYRPSSKSRWGVVTLSTVASFLATFLLALVGVPLWGAALLGLLFSLALFLLLYYFTGRASYSAASMPAVSLSEELQEELYQAALESGRGAWKRTVGGVRTVVLWNESEAYQLSAVLLEEKLAVTGGRFRREELSHRGVPLSSWLLQLAYRLAPLRGAGGASLTLVLLDEASKNGREARTIGLATPDSSKLVPVGLLPARELIKRKQWQELLEAVEEEFSQFSFKLSKRQLRALDSHLPEDPEGSEEAEDSEKLPDEGEGLQGEAPSGEGSQGEAH